MMVATGLTFSNHNINTHRGKGWGVPGLASIHEAYIDTIANAVPR